MKIHSECIPCLFDRAKFECDLAFGDNEEGKLKALFELARFASLHIGKNTVPAMLGTERGRIISRISGVEDPYADLKKESNRAGKEALKAAVRYYNEAEDPLEALLRIAAAANSMEYGVRGHVFNEELFEKEFLEILEEELSGDIALSKDRIIQSSKILYLLDNAGEAVIDLFVIEELEKMGKKVFVSPKSAPIINDITADELSQLGFDTSKVVPSGAYVGVSLEEAPEEFLSLLFDPEMLVIAKGMGNYETLSEFQFRLAERLIYIFRAKCISVAENAKVKRGMLVVDTV